METLPGWTWDVLEEDFQQGLEALRSFVAREGHARVPAAHQEGEFKLGAWVHHYRIDHKKQRLTDEHVAALETLPGWTWDPWEEDFQEGLEALRSFVARTGHARVTQGHQEGEFRLGTWVTSRRVDHRKRKLTDERVAALETVPGWTWDVLEEDFQQGLEVLRLFVARTGHARVPDGHREGEFQLGKWVQNRHTDHGKGKLTDERVATLEAVPGWTWDAREEDFQRGLEVLRLFVAREGHARVPQRHREGEFRLGKWVNSRRTDQRKRKLTDDHVAVLEAVPGWTWDPGEEDFQHGLEVLSSFVARTGHVRVPKGHREGEFRLGGWVANLRYRKGKLTDERVAALEAVPGWTWGARGER